MLLGLSGVLIVAFSVLGSMGLCSLFGVKSTLIIVEVIPFLVLAVCDYYYYFCSLANHVCMCIIIIFLWVGFGRGNLISCVVVDRSKIFSSIPGFISFAIKYRLYNVNCTFNILFL